MIYGLSESLAIFVMVGALFILAHLSRSDGWQRFFLLVPMVIQINDIYHIGGFAKKGRGHRRDCCNGVALDRGLPSVVYSGFFAVSSS